MDKMQDRTKDIFQMCLAVIIVTSCFTFFFWISASKLATNNNHIGEIKTAMIAFMGGILGYYFGSSASNSKNADVLRELVKPPDGTTTLKTVNPTEPTKTETLDNGNNS
jgi:uncharacterized membrane protein YsdA (DUF1294 family)